MAVDLEVFQVDSLSFVNLIHVLIDQVHHFTSLLCVLILLLAHWRGRTRVLDGRARGVVLRGSLDVGEVLLSVVLSVGEEQLLHHFLS